MDRREMKLTVLARIPNLNSSKASGPPEEPPTSRGRIISQVLSFKVLAGVVLVLVAVAIVPAFKPATPTPESTATAEAWHPGELAASADAAPAWPAPVAESPASSSPMPNILEKPNVASVTPVSASIDEPLMSPWPNPSQATNPRNEGGAEEPRAGVNQSMALRPFENIRK